MSNELCDEYDLVPEYYVTGTGQRMRVHSNTACAGNHCSVHNPSNHPLKDAPTHWRDDRLLMERICSHGIGHPDPDDIDFIRQRRGNQYAHNKSVHGCDGCCIK